MSFIMNPTNSVVDSYSQCKRNLYTFSVTFGKWLIEKRNEARLTQVQLAERSGISANYVSALERDEPNARDGSPRRPRIDKVRKLAKALNADPDEALHAAGYAGSPKKPTNATEFLEALAQLNIPGFEFVGAFDGIENLSPERYQELLESIKIAVEISLRRSRK